MSVGIRKHMLKHNYAKLVQDLVQLGSPDDKIQEIVVGAFGAAAGERVKPLLTIIHTFKKLTPAEQIEILQALVETQEAASAAKATAEKPGS